DDPPRGSSRSRPAFLGSADLVERDMRSHGFGGRVARPTSAEGVGRGAGRVACSARGVRSRRGAGTAAPRRPAQVNGPTQGLHSFEVVRMILCVAKATSFDGDLTDQEKIRAKLEDVEAMIERRERLRDRVEEDLEGLERLRQGLLVILGDKEPE